MELTRWTGRTQALAKGPLLLRVLKISIFVSASAFFSAFGNWPNKDTTSHKTTKRREYNISNYCSRRSATRREEGNAKTLGRDVKGKWGVVRNGGHSPQIRTPTITNAIQPNPIPNQTNRHPTTNPRWNGSGRNRWNTCLWSWMKMSRMRVWPS